MNLAGIDALWAQVGRLLSRVENRDPESYEWVATLEDGRSQRYVANGVPDPQRIDDDARMAFRLLWDYRDYYVNEAERRGRRRDDAYRRVRSEPTLMLCSDIANKLKHEVLKHPNTNLDPTLTPAAITVPQGSIAGIIVTSDFIGIQGRNQEFIVVTMPVVSAEGHKITDGLSLLRDVATVWEGLTTDLRGAA